MVLENALYVTALPIGNYLDISKNALAALEGADCIAAEDTRKIKSLAQYFRINLRQVVSHHNHNESQSLDGVLALLKEGKSVVLVSDAGTPNISDPGFRLARACFENDIKIKSLPGASSLTCALSLCPLGGTDHYFCGFLPSKESDRVKKLNSIKALTGHCSKAVIFEAPHRLNSCLENIKDTLGDPEVFVARELTKEYESFYWGKASDVIANYPQGEVKGEFVICISLLNTASTDSLSTEDLKEKIKTKLSEGKKAKAIQKELAGSTKLSGKELYQLISNIKDSL